MAGFTSIGNLVDGAETYGRSKITSFRKAASITLVANTWYDSTMWPGFPKAQYYAATPQAFAPLKKSTDVGLDIGGNVSPYTRHLQNIFLSNANQSTATVAGTYILCDFLGYYPFWDMSDDTEQPADNSLSLTRYTTDKNIQMVCVCVAPGTTGAVSFSVKYTNQNGVTDRTTGSIGIAANATYTHANSLILSTINSTGTKQIPFLPLQAGDSGVQSIQSVTMSSLDTGLFTIALVKPICTLSTLSAVAPVELNFPVNHPGVPRIYDDAYLGFLVNVSTSQIPSFIGMCNFVWG